MKKVSVWVVVYCTKTNRYLLGLRGPKMNNPGLWNLWGGSVDEGERLHEAAARELYEEAGLYGTLTSLGSLVNGRTAMYYYLLEKFYEVNPKLDTETAKAQWLDLDKIRKLKRKGKLHLPTYKLFNSGLLNRAPVDV